MLSKNLVVSFLLFSCFFATEVSLAQEASSSHEAEMQRLREEIDRQRLINELNELQQAPDASQNAITRLQGSDGHPENAPLFEGRTLVYEALDSVSSALARDIVSKVCSSSSCPEQLTLVIYDDSSFNEVRYYRSYDIIRKYIILTYHEQFGLGEGLDEEESSIVSSITGGFNAAAILGESIINFISLFRVDRTFQAFPLDVSHSHLVSLLSQDLGKISEMSPQYNFKIYEPEQYSFEFSNTFSTRDGPLVKLLEQISEIESLNQRADEELLQASASNLASGRIQDLAEFSKFSKDFVKALSQFDATSNIYNLFRLAKASQLSDLISESETFVLKLRIIGAEVDRRTTRSLFSGSQASYSAGVIAEYKVFNDQSELFFGDILHNQTGYSSGAESNTEL